MSLSSTFDAAKAIKAAPALNPPKRVATTKRGANAKLADKPVEKGARNAPETCSAAKAALVDPDKPLTAQQLAFAQAWARGESIGSASLRAGYKDDGIGYRMARMPNILRVYNEEKRKFEEAAQMSRKRVMEGLLEAIEMAKLMAEPASMISGWREIGRMCGYYEPIKHVVKVSGQVTMKQVNTLSDEELLKIVKGEGDLPLAAPQTPQLESDDAPE